MISVVIPTLNAERTLTATLAALVPAAIDGAVREVIIADGGSRDRTREIADQAGADIVESAAGRGTQLAHGAAIARAPWLLFLHADTVLSSGWDVEALAFIRDIEGGYRNDTAAAFRFQLDDRGFRARALEATVRARCALLAMPYGDQGLLISRRLFDEVGGYRDLPIMEDVDLMSRIGRRRLHLFETPAVTSAVRFRKDGYLARSVRNQICLAMYGAGLPASTIVRIYGRAKT